MLRSTTIGESMNIAYPYSFLPYGSFQLTYLVFNKHCYNILNSQGVPIPYHLEHAVAKGEWYARNKYTLATVSTNYNPAYDQWSKDWYRAWFRKLYGNDVDPLPYPSQNTSQLFQRYNTAQPNGDRDQGEFYQPIRSEWTPLPASPEWIDFYDAPPNITVVFGINQANNAVDAFVEINNTAVGRLHRSQFIVHPSDSTGKKVALRILAASQASPPLNYDTHVQGKTLYIWIAGATRPIKMILLSENKTTSTSWEQIWEFPANKNSLKDFVEFFSETHVVRVMYADDSPIYEFNFPSDNQSTGILGESDTDKIVIRLTGTEYDNTTNWYSPIGDTNQRHDGIGEY